FYTRAAEMNPKWHKAWQRLAILYYNLVMNHVTVLPEEEAPAPVVGPSNMIDGAFVGGANDYSQDPLPPLLLDDDEADNNPPQLFSVQSPEQETLPVGEGAFTSSAYMDTESARRLPVADNDALKQLPTQLFEYAMRAVQCHFEALVHSSGSRMEDTLRLLMLWIQYGEHIGVLNTIKGNLRRVSLEIWLEVAPQ
uniref:FAT domain-containing protein n=1 Tax=Panagrellus redivivus TaxID=6233 RepID=A0A7E4ZZF4_PANRE